jgi:hypothetical protein
MQLGGSSKEVILNCDLTRYDNRLTKGQKGKTIPDFKCGIWGTQDRFVAVKFDCGATMDILISSLDYEGQYINS